MEEEIEQLKSERDEYLAGWKRAKADLANYKKEEGERKEEWLEYIQGSWIHKILPVLDNLERAEQEMPENRGVQQIALQLREVLRREGIEELHAQGEMFTPELHEAIEEVEVTEKGAGEVVEVAEKGYTWNGKLLRPAKVKVTK